MFGVLTDRDALALALNNCTSHETFTMAHAKSTDPNVFILPDLGEGVHEAELIAWKVKPGDTVKEHEILAEMETDKALVEVPSPRSGTIKTLHGDEGEILHVGNPLVTYEAGKGSGAAPPTKPAAGPAGEPAVAHGDAHSNGSAASAEREDAGTVVGQMTGGFAGVTRAEGKALATPKVRRIARDLGVDINTVVGTGIGGRVLEKDVHAAAEGGQSAPRPQQPSTSQQAPQETRRPLPSTPQQPSYQPQPYPAPQPMPQQFAAPMQGQMSYAGMQPGMPMGAMPVLVPTPFGYVPMMPMGMPGYGPGYGMGGAAGVPAAPGFTPFPSGRPIPDPAQQSGATPAQPEARVAFRGVRRTIADRLRSSVDTAVHFTVMDEADVTALDAKRREMSVQAQAQSGVKLSFLPFVAAAVCRALTTRFGAMNATVDEQAGEIVQHGAVHLGIATDTDSGLMVPVIRDAHAMDPVQLATAIAETAAAARDRSIPRDRLMGSTFTISNVGSHAGRFATPVINVPEVAILAVGKVYDGVVVRDGQAMVGKVMPLSLACDHRVVDGATAALALAEIVQELSNS